MTYEQSRRSERDEGLTLIELVVVIALLGLVVTVLSAAIVVTIRQAPEASARVQSARWEQTLERGFLPT